MLTTIEAMPSESHAVTGAELKSLSENGGLILSIEPLPKNWNLPILKQLGCDCGCCSE